MKHVFCVSLTPALVIVDTNNVNQYRKSYLYDEMTLAVEKMRNILTNYHTNIYYVDKIIFDTSMNYISVSDDNVHLSTINTGSSVPHFSDW